VPKYDTEGKIVSINLDIKNPHSLEVLEHREPQELLDDILRKEQRVVALLSEVSSFLETSA